MLRNIGDRGELWDSKWSGLMNVHAMKSIADTGAAMVGEVENAASGVLESGADVARYAGRQARTIGSEVEDFVRQNPLASMGGALAVGLLVGIMARSRMSR
jgi:ElaB/YqjD/DUF883 family membrane-anchored ribosome-binding protein